MKQEAAACRRLGSDVAQQVAVQPDSQSNCFVVGVPAGLNQIRRQWKDDCMRFYSKKCDMRQA